MAGRDRKKDDSTRGMIVSAAQLGFVAAAAVLVYSFVAVAREGESRRVCAPTCLIRPDYAGAERRAPDFTLPDMKGQMVSLASLRGKVVVLNFWTKTCGPCLEEFPDLAELAGVLKTRNDVAMLAVSIDDGPSDVAPTLKSVLKGDPPFPILFDPESKIVKGKYGTTLFPETWIIDKQGVIRARFDGGKDWTNPTIVELVDQIRRGDYCKVRIKDGTPEGDGAAICETLRGG